MKTFILSLAITAVTVSVCSAANSHAGASTAQFLKLGAGARASGMGEAFVGVVHDAAAIYWNPGGLSTLRGGSLSFMHAAWFEDINYQWAAYACPVRGFGIVGAAVQYLSYGSLEKRDATGLDGGTLSPSDMAASLSYAGNIGRYGVGMNLKYITTTIEHSAAAVAADIGVQRALGPRLTVGCVAQNMGSGMTFISEEDPLPMTIKLGGAWAITRNWLAAVDANAPNDDDIGYGAGTEYACRLGTAARVAARLGYTTSTRDTGRLNSVTAGLGVTFQEYTIDYAYVPYGNLGSTQRVSLTINFTGPRQKSPPVTR